MIAMPSAVHARPLTEALGGLSSEAAFDARLAAFCSAFLPSVAGVVAITRAALKNAGSPRDPVSVYRRAVIALMHRADFELPAPDCALSANVAWLLRDAAKLSDAQIADVLTTSAPDIQSRIEGLCESVLSWDW